MNKKKLSTEDGSEFTVFYLKNKEQEEKQIAPVGWLGTNELESYIELGPKAWEGCDIALTPPADVYNISIDDTIPSDFIDTLEFRPQSIYKVAGLNLLAKFVGSFSTVVPDGNKILLQMKRHGTVFYVEEASLIKATDVEVQKYLEKKVD